MVLGVATTHTTGEAENGLTRFGEHDTEIHTWSNSCEIAKSSEVSDIGSSCLPSKWS